MKYMYPSAISPVIQQLLLDPTAVEFDSEQKQWFESQFGYHLQSALEMFFKGASSDYAQYAEELIQIAARKKSQVITVASIFIKLQSKQSLNDLTISLLSNEVYNRHAPLLLDFLTIVELHQPRLITPEFFTELCQIAQFLDDEEIMNSFFERYYRLGKQNRLSLEKVKQVFAICHTAQQPAVHTKQALLALSQPKRQVYDTTLLDMNTNQRERSLVARWEQENLYSTAIQRPGNAKFVTYDGPPFATGLPHYGHVLAMSIKGAISAHKALSGLDVETRFGWDCHGVPVEMIVQKKLGLDGHNTIMQLGIDRFNQECRQQGRR